jgi:hypothetical protein
VGTAKAAVDFARQFMGVRFLYPDLPGYTPVSGAAKIDLLASPAIEFLPMKTMTVPESLNVTTTPLLRVNTAHPAGASFYDLAHNRFPRVDEEFGGHTWERAVPADLFAEHPEYKDLYHRFTAENRVNNGGDWPRFWSLILNLKQVLESDVQGDFAELGVWRGNVAAVLAHVAALHNRQVHLFDTFDGFDGRDLTGIDSDKDPLYGDTSVELVRAVIGSNSNVC